MYIDFREALKLLSAFHHRNDIWIRRNIALSYAQLKQYESVLDELKELITYERLWFLFADMANIHKKRQDVNNAFLHALNAALTEGDIQIKIKVFQLIVRLLEILQLYDEVPLHLRLILAIRKKRKWNISQYFLENIKKYQLTADELEDEMTLYRKLQKVWHALKNRYVKQNTGEIIKIFPDGKASFLKDQNSQTFYFLANEFLGQRKLLRVGQHVCFYTAKGFDKKKQKVAVIAMQILPLFSNNK